MLRQPPTWICAAIAAVALVAFTLPRYGVPRIGAGFNPSSVSVRAGESLDQLMAVRAWGLHTVTVQLVAIDAVEFLDVELEHRENGVPLTVTRTTVGLTDTGGLPIRFAPAPSGPNAEFVLRLRPRSPDGAGAVTFQTTEGHEYREGRLWLQGEALPLDLVLDADALTARAWPAFASLLHRRTGVPGLEWLFAFVYLAGACAVVRVAASRDAP